MFDDEDALVRVDMSEYREQHTVSRLFGAPPGYVGYEEGGQLTEAVRRRPYRVVLFDEIEKAHPDVWNALLQILDDGRLTDGQGRVVDFRNTVLIMTSNLGTEFVRKSGSLGFLRRGEDDVDTDDNQDKIERALKQTFRPEFLNRVDEIITFKPLAIADAIRLSRAGLKNPRRPIGSFIFLGSSGVGKTELAKALAEFMFDDEEAIVRIDMSEYREQHTASRLFGAPPGYIGYEEGGQLTEAVRRRPYRVILFDEIEKAHPDIWNSLLQILDDGRLTDGQGRTVDFSNTVIIMTSNLGTEFAKRGGALGFVQGNDEQAIADHQKIEKALRETFRPEFLNRIDEIIIFEPLTLPQVESIVDLQLQEIAERLAERGLSIHLTEPARQWLAQKGWDPQFGARPLRRSLQRYVENELSAQLLRGTLRNGDLIVIDEVDGKLVFERHENASTDYINLRQQRNYID
jgi:ATP-dependent Clp protease ATP-binding subunit ClpA